MVDHPVPIEAYRQRTLRAIYGRLVTVASKVLWRYRASFDDPELTVEDLTQLAAVKALVGFDRSIRTNAEFFLSLPAENLQVFLIRCAAQDLAWHVRSTYRRRDSRRAAVAPEALLDVVDDTVVTRIALWERIEPLLPSLSERQQKIVRGLWDGADTATVAADLGVSANVIQKDLAAIRKLAA